MLKIHQLFLRTYLAIFIAILITLTLATYFWAKNLYINQIEKNLIQNLDTLAVVLENSKDINSLNSVVLNLSQVLALRVSVIDELGNVIAESHKNLDDIKNHSNRVEIIEAKNIGIGKDTRVSETLGKDLLYIARKIEIDGKTYYIRMADYTNKITDNFKSLTIEIFIYILLFLFLAFFGNLFYKSKNKKRDRFNT